MGNQPTNLKARIAEIGAQTARFQSAKGGGHRPGWKRKYAIAMSLPRSTASTHA